MYKIGDLIYYSNTGICRIKDITKPEMAGAMKDQLYYVLETLYQECVIYTPVDNKKVFMRPIISSEEANELIDAIPSVQTEAFHSKTMNQLAVHYEKLIKTHCCEDLVELTMSIYAKKQFAEQNNRKFGAVDEKFMKRAEELLFGELAAALEIPRDQVPEYIADRVGCESIQDCV